MLNLVHSMLINHSRNTILNQHVPTSKNESSVITFGRLKPLLTQTLPLPKADVPKLRYASHFKLYVW